MPHPVGGGMGVTSLVLRALTWIHRLRSGTCAAHCVMYCRRERLGQRAKQGEVKFM